MGTLTDEDLRHLMGEAAAAFAVPDDAADAVREAHAEGVVVPLRRRRWVQVPAAAAVLVLAVTAGALLTGQRGGDSVTVANAPAAASSGGALEPQAAAAASAPKAVRDGAQLPAPLQAEDRAAAGPLARVAAPGRGAAPQPAPSPPKAAPVKDGARIVKTGTIELIVAKGRVSSTLTAVQALATEAGGVVASAKTQEAGPAPSGSVVLRVPAAQFEDVVAKVRGLDAKVSSASTSGQDVTAQYADVQTQIRTLQAARERFLVILSSAKSVGDILAVQQRVDDVTGQIDRLEGQRRVLADQSEMSTLRVSVGRAADVGQVQPRQNGLIAAFGDAWDGFATGVQGLIRLSGRAVLLAMCLAVLALALRVGWRVSRRRLV